MSEPATCKKQIERRALETARRACSTIPSGEIHEFEKPDFKVETGCGTVGIEVTELLPRAGSDAFSSRLEEKSFHEKVVHLAEQEYNNTPGAVPVEVKVFFWNIPGRKYDRRVMAKSLAEFVRSHRAQATPVATFDWRPDMPEGFGVISISATTGSWWSGESVNLVLDQIHQQIAERIEAKNKVLPTYRYNLPGVPIWLLIYSGMEISRGVPIPHGIDDRTFSFEFDRVIFFSSLGNEVAEVRRSDRGSNEFQHIF
jgi:hypothetical protein